ncbi:MAG: hypothetical protein ACRD1X_12335 [Vicinamibacteria bacterium]
MTQPFISMNVGSVQKGVQAIGQKLDATFDRILRVTTKAIVEIANDTLQESQQRLEPQTRSGDLSRSGVVEEPVITGEEISVRWGFNKRYARQRDQGGPIVPKNARLLAIPLDPVLTARGVPRYASPREDTGAPNGMFVLRLWGHLFLAHFVGARGKGNTRLEFRWLLVDRVEQKGSQFFTRPIKEATPDIPRRIAERVAGVLGGGDA